MKLLIALSSLFVAAVAFACDGPQSQSMGSMNMLTGYNAGLSTNGSFIMADGGRGWVLPPMQRLAPITRPAQEELPADIEALREALRAEKEFKRTGPELFTMEEANAMSRKTGKPVLCWMGPHVFANAKARERSLALADTTIQAVMDSDGETKDAKGNPLPMHRVKFTDQGFYSKDSKVAFIPVAKLDEKSDAKILSFVRGGK